MPNEAYLKRTYGLTLSDWVEMYENQRKLCKICRKPFNKFRRATVDHNHQTGKVRALLCDMCNQDLGFYEYVKDAMERYLKECDK